MGEEAQLAKMESGGKVEEERVVDEKCTGVVEEV